jgi:polyhydroxyalkanoate synthesis regulator phasin
MTTVARRNSSSVTNLLSNIVDDIKDFVDDEVIDRTKDTERDLRKAGRNWTDSDDDESTSSSDDVADLKAAITALTKKVDALSKKA